jgi:hypothetical protein
MPLDGGLGPAVTCPGGGGADELADGLGRQAQHRVDLGVGLALGEQVVDHGVTFPGTHSQAARARVLVGGGDGRRGAGARFGGIVARPVPSLLLLVVLVVLKRLVKSVRAGTWRG